jgi:AcrR family transcriptional regulator
MAQAGMVFSCSSFGVIAVVRDGRTGPGPRPSGLPTGRGGEPNPGRGEPALALFVCTAYKFRVPQPSPRPHPRATREAGRQTRRALLDAAGSLFAEHGVAGVSAAEIARQAGAFPSQVTYYFGSKEALFVEAACRGVLHAAAEVERAGTRTRSPRGYVRAVVHTALASPELLNFVEAALLVRRRPELAPRVRETFARLHLEGERAVAESLVARGWRIRAAPATEARGFWASILGIALERAALGETFDDATADATVQLVLNLYSEPHGRGKGPDSNVRSPSSR